MKYDAKAIFIIDTLKARANAGGTMKAVELSNLLTSNGFTNSYGEYYKGGRGVFKMISKLYGLLDRMGMILERDIIGMTFRKKNNDLAWK